MRYILVPHTIDVSPPKEVNPDAKPEPFPFIKYAFIAWMDDDEAIKGGFSKQVRWAKVIDLFRASEPGKYIQLEDEDWKTLNGIVEKPTRRLPPSITIQLIAYSRAVTEAVDKLPAALVPEAAQAS